MMSEKPAAAIQNRKSMFSAPPLIERWIRCLLGLTVGVAAGLAPYLGKYEVPLFDSVFKLIPTSLQDVVPIFSAALMSLVAVFIQFCDQTRVEPRKLEKAFKFTLILAGVSLISLIVVHSFVVVKVPYLAGRASETFLVGFNKPGKPPCTPEMSKATCIQRISLDVGKVETYWGDPQITTAKLVLLLVYLSFTSAMGLLVGFLLLINPKLDTDDTSQEESPPAVENHGKEGREVPPPEGG
jgi:hypothetical protein